MTKQTTIVVIGSLRVKDEILDHWLFIQGVSSEDFNQNA